MSNSQAGRLFEDTVLPLANHLGMKPEIVQEILSAYGKADPSAFDPTTISNDLGWTIEIEQLSKNVPAVIAEPHTLESGSIALDKNLSVAEKQAYVAKAIGLALFPGKNGPASLSPEELHLAEHAASVILLISSQPKEFVLYLNKQKFGKWLYRIASFFRLEMLLLKMMNKISFKMAQNNVSDSK